MLLLLRTLWDILGDQAVCVFIRKYSHPKTALDFDVTKVGGSYNNLGLTVLFDGSVCKLYKAYVSNLK